MKLNKLIAIATISLLSGGISMAQKALNLEDIVAGNVIQTKGIGSMTWLKDGERYSCLENNKQTGGTDIVAYRAKDNSREVIIPSSLLTDKSTGRPIPVRSVSWSADNEKVLIYNNTQRVWRYDTRGDYWVLNLKDGALRQLGKGMPESSMMFAKFSPDGTRVAYVSNNNIYVEDIDSGKITQLTKDGSDTIVNGTFDWVYEEEFSCRDGFRWSPDGKHIAYWQSDTKGTGVFDIINNVDSIYAKVIHFPYPKAGTTNSAVKVGYVSSTGGNTTWIAIPGDPRNNYLPRMEFIPESDELFIQQLNRPQNTNKVWIAKISDNSLNNIFTDTDAAWLDTNDNIQWLKDNRYFTWESERSGWRHLYRISRDGKEIQPITKGDFDVTSIYAQNKNSLLVGRTDMNHNADLFSVDLKKGTMNQVTEVNKQNYAKITPSKTELKMVKTTDGKEMGVWFVYPPDFDPNKKYPTLLYCQGGPQSALTQFFSTRWSPALMAAKGYIVVAPNRRGMPGWGTK